MLPHLPATLVGASARGARRSAPVHLFVVIAPQAITNTTKCNLAVGALVGGVSAFPINIADMTPFLLTLTP